MGELKAIWRRMLPESAEAPSELGVCVRVHVLKGAFCWLFRGETTAQPEPVVGGSRSCTLANCIMWFFTKASCCEE